MRALVAWIEAQRHARVVELTPLPGGDINQAYRVRLDDGSALFVKSHPRPPFGLFDAEAAGLRWLAETKTVLVPEVLAVGHGPVSVLLLEYLQPVSPKRATWERLGRELAALHQSDAERFGLERSNFIGLLCQDNVSSETWADFWIHRRLEPMFQKALDTRAGPPRWRSRLANVFAQVRQLIVEPSCPERIHGDLWSGNLLHTERGPALIDPAVYAGHGEVDLAMMQLFGGFDERVFQAYLEVRRNGAGLPERIKAYQLYPLLVHVNLFGGSYVGAVDELVEYFGN